MKKNFRKIMVYVTIPVICVVLLFVLWKLYVQYDINSRSGIYTDARDGKSYKTIQIGEQIWFAENFSYDGGADCKKVVFEGIDFGMLYNWEAAKNLCPEGWHLPSQEEWETLADNLGGYEKAGHKLKTKNQWKSAFSLQKGTSGFHATPAGYNMHDQFRCQTEFAYFWSLTLTDEKGFYAFSVSIVYSHSRIYLDSTAPLEYFYSVRYIKD